MNEDNNIIGKIYSVACKDFVTYDEGKLYPGEYLNIILGPNGTGKSTLVAAIILGMGGSPKVLSRSSNIESYVKNGKEKAWIEITIYKNTSREKITFERTFDLRGKSVWKIDGAEVGVKEYIRQVHSYNIQVDNLCQFLPQDRVQDFAKMNSKEILASTINSICDQDLIDKFTQLKNFRHEQSNFKKTLTEYQQEFRESEQQNEDLKEKIEQMRIRNTYMKEINICAKKKTWLECDEIKTKMEQVQTELQQANSFVDRDQKNYDEIKKQTKGINDYIKGTEKELAKNKSLSEKYAEQIDQVIGKIEDLERSIRRAKAELAAKKAEEVEKESEIKNSVTVLQAVYQDYQNARTTHGTEDQIQKKAEVIGLKAESITLEIRKLLDKRRELNRTLDEDYEPELKAIKRKVSSIENIKERRLNMLRSRFEDTYNAVVWLRQNRHLFEGQIYEPMILELNVNNADNAKYFENTVGMADLLAFTCTNKSDLDILIRKLCNEQKLQVNALHSEEASECSFRATEPIENLRKYGFHSYLIDMVDGPAPILNFLCKSYNIHKILVGTDKVNEYSDRLPSNIFLFFTPSYKYSISFSRYTNDKSSMRVNISSKNILCMSIDLQDLNILKDKFRKITRQSDIIKNERTEIEGKISTYEEKRNDVLTEKKELEKKRLTLLNFLEKLKSQKHKVERLKNSNIDLKQEEIKFKEFAAKVVNDMIQNQNKCADTLKLYQESIIAAELINTKLQIFKQQHSDLEDVEKSRLEELKKSLNLVQTITKQYENFKKKHHEKINEAMNSCEGKKLGDPNFPFAKAFRRLPDDIPSLTDHIDEIQSRLDCMGAGYQGVIEEYESRKNRMEYLRQSIERMNLDRDLLERKMNETHEEWYPKIAQIVEQINENFTKFMTLMQYAGEVQLIRNEEYDYESYGIQILVQYRDNVKLQVLDRFVQSGGERAVAIAVYSLSLQRLTNVPFRCVDEINQGMDPKNERKIFELLVEETSKEDQPQYFFISPKLLPNLKYNDLMSVHIVFNGHFIEEHDLFIT